MLPPMSSAPMRAPTHASFERQPFRSSARSQSSPWRLKIFTARTYTAALALAGRRRVSCFVLGDPEAEPWPWPDSLDALAAAPESHRLLFENDRVRVLE